MDNQSETGAGLGGYRALDLTDERGYLCGKILADMGADVIKIEPPGGDPGRLNGPFYHDERDPEKSLFWWAWNTSKRGITLDITSAAGRAAFLEMVKKSDFVIESFAPGYMAKLALSYDDLAKVNPGIIMISITAFGQDGPYIHYKAPDLVMMALGGYIYLIGDEDRRPLRISVPQAYYHACNEGAAAGLIALWHRERTGLGQWIDVSTQECLVWLTFSNHAYWDFQRVSPTRADAGSAGLQPGQPRAQLITPCKDGFILFQPTYGQQGPLTRALATWIEQEGMAPELMRTFDWDVRLLNDPTLTEEEKEERRALLRELRETFKPFFLTKTKKELFDQAIAKGFLLAPVNSLHDLAEDRHFKARGFWQTVDHPEVGEKIRYPGAPFIASTSRYLLRRRAPLIGEHNEEIRREMPTWPERTGLPAWDAEDTTEVFKGLKIADFTWVAAGPRAARYFADHGATVIKVENPDRPDIGRSIPPHRDDISEPDRSGWFALYNVNKLDIAINLRLPEGLELAKRLIKWADVLIESNRPGALRGLGLGYEAVKDLNPGLIYVSSSQLGQTGPYSRFGGYGHHAAAMTGFHDLTGWPDRPPCGLFWAYTDHISPQYMVTAIVTALLERQRTGKGQYIDQSQNEAGLQFLAPHFLDYVVNGRTVERNANRDPHAAPHNVYQCVGVDRWCAIAVFTDEEWRAFCRVIGQPALAQDSRFATLALRKQNEDELDQLVENWTINLTAETVMHRLQQAGVPAGVLYNAEDLHCDPQLRLRQHYVTVDHSVIGPHQVDTLPYRFSRTPVREYRPEPCLGEHNAYVCTEILGLSDEDFVRYLEIGVFGLPEAEL